MPGGMPENAEVIGFEIDEEPKWITVRLQDGSVIQIKMEIVSIARAGNDMNTGLPLYMVQATNIIRMQKVPKELIAKKKAVEDQRQSMYR
ncbi:MAG: hypothetical protein M1306_00870 [Candidatus Thermoplasmatota archaeon]|jgi:hypothetical protein|nr:hypothetical protein [Candidatus Thermoplasmatota archaeon]